MAGIAARLFGKVAEAAPELGKAAANVVRKGVTQVNPAGALNVLASSRAPQPAGSPNGKSGLRISDAFAKMTGTAKDLGSMEGSAATGVAGAESAVSDPSTTSKILNALKGSHGAPATRDSPLSSADSSEAGKSEGMSSHLGSAVSSALTPMSAASAGAKGLGGAVLGVANAVASHVGPGSAVDTVGQIAENRYSNEKESAVLQDKNSGNVDMTRLTEKLQKADSLAKTLAEMSKQEGDFIKSMFQ